MFSGYQRYSIIKEGYNNSQVMNFTGYSVLLHMFN